MKKLFYIAILLLSANSFCQDYKTGDADLDATLKNVVTEANKNLTAFKTDLTKKFSVTLEKVESCFKIGMDAADALMAFQVSSLTKKPIEDVLTVYKKSKSKGWGAMAKELGIKPGSPEFHALKGKTSSNGNSKGNSGKSNGNGKGKK